MARGVYAVVEMGAEFVRKGVWRGAEGRREGGGFGGLGFWGWEVGMGMRGVLM